MGNGDHNLQTAACPQCLHAHETHAVASACGAVQLNRSLIPRPLSTRGVAHRMIRRMTMYAVLTGRLLLAARAVGAALRGVVVVLGEEDPEGAVRQSEDLRDVELDPLLLELERPDPAQQR